VIHSHEPLLAAESVDELRREFRKRFDRIEISKGDRTELFPAPVRPITLGKYENDCTKNKRDH
jgi:hypothetical protein